MPPKAASLMKLANRQWEGRTQRIEKRNSRNAEVPKLGTHSTRGSRGCAVGLSPTTILSPKGWDGFFLPDHRPTAIGGKNVRDAASQLWLILAYLTPHQSPPYR